MSDEIITVDFPLSTKGVKILSASKKIILKPGFHVKAGSPMYMFIKGLYDEEIKQQPKGGSRTENAMEDRKFLEEKFLDWHTEEKKDLSWMEGLPSAPSRILEENGNRIKPNLKKWEAPRKLYPFEKKYHPDAVYTMRSYPNSYGAGQQACYDKNGVLLPPGDLSAGSADKFSPLVQFEDQRPEQLYNYAEWQAIALGRHNIHDVLPFDLALALDGGKPGKYVGMYFEVRPPPCKIFTSPAEEQDERAAAERAAAEKAAAEKAAAEKRAAEKAAREAAWAAERAERAAAEKRAAKKAAEQDHEKPTSPAYEQDHQ